jgi:hypothetical protein
LLKQAKAGANVAHNHLLRSAHGIHTDADVLLSAVAVKRELDGAVLAPSDTQLDDDPWVMMGRWTLPQTGGAQCPNGDGRVED